ncbi:MAG TPA: alpha/beta fold hydrolase, partial [Candidatus Limnocylindrales bacterium]|nr:alpha/beta fold hydrolase [Candidatus Limnocylindrales bacterium]
MIETAPPALRETSGRARLPDSSGSATSADGTRLAWDVYGSGDPTIVFLPDNPIIHSRQWKGQVPYLARHFRVVTYDGRGNGLADRPTTPEAYTDERILDDLECVMDATETRAAVLVGLCGDGVWRSIEFAAQKPERVLGIVAFAVGVPLLSAPHPWRVAAAFHEERARYEGWELINEHAWRRDYARFAQFFFSQITSEPHSTKAIEDAVVWAVDGSVEAMIAEAQTGNDWTLESVEATCRAVRCPML